MTDPDTLTAALTDAHGPALAALTVTEAFDVADQLRAIAAALPGPSTLDAHVATQLTEAAKLVERLAGITKASTHTGIPTHHGRPNHWAACTQA